MLLRGAESFARELADTLGGMTWDEACPLQGALYLLCWLCRLAPGLHLIKT